MDAFLRPMRAVVADAAPFTRISIFGGLELDTLDFLMERAERVSVAKGDIFFRQGEPGGALYILQRGTAEALRSNEDDPADGKVICVGEIEAGGCFGEVSLLAVMPRSATVVAREDCEALRLRYGALHDLYEYDVAQFALLMINLGREVARRLWKADQMLMDFAEPKS